MRWHTPINAKSSAEPNTGVRRSAAQQAEVNAKQRRANAHLFSCRWVFYQRQEQQPSQQGTGRVLQSCMPLSVLRAGLASDRSGTGNDGAAYAREHGFLEPEPEEESATFFAS